MSKYNIPDYHLHTLFSGDCDTPLEDIIASALGKGLTSMCITDHNDLDFPIIPHDDDGNPISFDLDIDSYIPRLLSLQKEVLEKYNFDLRIGVEQGVNNTLGQSGVSFALCQLSQTVGVHGVGELCLGVVKIQSLGPAHLGDMLYGPPGVVYSQAVLFGEAGLGIPCGVLSGIRV